MAYQFICLWRLIPCDRHYGRLVFAMVARHFVDADELVGYLTRNPGVTEEQARALYLQVQGKDYSPPRRERILEWQREQEFPICPDPDNPDACNVYKDLKFPPDRPKDRLIDSPYPRLESSRTARGGPTRRG
jgi:hypothetical protein